MENNKKEFDNTEIQEEVDEAPQAAEEQGEAEEEKNIKKEIFSFVKIFVGAFIVAYLLSNFVIVNARVPSGSMISTINVGDKVIGFRLSYLFSDPKRGDIVMFNAPDKEKTIYIKRIIGLPGDTIKIENNKLYINGELYEEKYVKNGWSAMTGPFTYEVPKGEYFMMGDNRDHSNDSRAWGTVKKDEIIAKAIFRYYPSVKSLMN
ncbi:MAG: signal peptidase I [Lachnospiraceae bacterium]|nr:signal peptidase I [Lachnospiraceae bacterium]